MKKSIIEIQGRKFEVDSTARNTDLAAIYKILGGGKVRHIDLPEDQEGFSAEGLAITPVGYILIFAKEIFE